MPKVANLPLFELYTIDELMRRLPYGLWYLADMHSGRRKPTERFKKTACGILNRSEAELFGNPETGQPGTGA